MNNAVYVSEEGIAEARESLLSCASELSELFDSINSVTNSIGSNVSGFTEIETVVDGLKQINSAKDALIDKIKEFANYLTENVNPGYNAFQQLFAGLLGSSGSLFENLGNLFGFGALGGNGYKGNGEVTSDDTSDEEYTGSHGGGGRFVGLSEQIDAIEKAIDFDLGSISHWSIALEEATTEKDIENARYWIEHWQSRLESDQKKLDELLRKQKNAQFIYGNN